MVVKSKKKKLTATLEDYLEVIYQIEKANRVVRAGEIAKKLGVGKSAVTSALKLLAKKGYINYNPYQFITLTKEGYKEAEEIIQKHDVIEKFFTDILRVDKKQADTVACKIEHVVNRNVIDRILDFMEHYRKNCKGKVYKETSDEV